MMTDEQKASAKAASTASFRLEEVSSIIGSLSLLLEFRRDATTPDRVVVALETTDVAVEPVAMEGTAVGMTGDLVGVGVGLAVGLSVG